MILKLWADLVRESEIADVRYHAGIVLGSYPKTVLREAEVTFDYPSLINASDASTQSIGRFLAKHLGEDISSIQFQPPPQANWRVGPYAISMVRFEPKDFVYQRTQLTYKKEKQDDSQYSVKRPFWTATTPVTEQMYRDFSSDLSSEKPEFNTDRRLDRFNLYDFLIDDPSQPAVAISLDQAYEFCNWLSRREGLAECYAAREVQPTDLTPNGLPAIPWNFDQNANGYRLPTNDEFHLAAQCGYPHPDNKHVGKIAAAGGYPEDLPSHAAELFTLIPNRSGIFQLDNSCGTWICGDEEITFYSVEDIGLLKGFHREATRCRPVGFSSVATPISHN